ncbi:MAG: hypothetical protein U9P70_03340 [Patescibacteria group bacterium]|nr:hypothetical protein [Patescibacteria group bacterium]
MSEKRRKIVFRKASRILAEKGICIKYIKDDRFNCQVSLIKDFPSEILWYHFKDNRIILEKGYLLASGKRASEKVAERLVDKIKHFILAFDDKSLALCLGESICIKRFSLLHPIETRVSREKIILAATQKFKEEGEITVEFKECEGNDEAGRYDCTICMIDDTS